MTRLISTLALLSYSLWFGGISSTLAAVPSLGFAKHLQSEGEYYRAITEYKRVLYFSLPESTDIRETAVLGIGASFFSGSEFNRAAEWTHEHLSDLHGDVQRRSGKNLMYKSFLEAGAGDRMLTIMEDVGDSTAESRLFLGLAHASVGHWSAAAQTFQGISTDQRLGSVAAGYARLALDAEGADWKRPGLATVLGIVPGGGYWYAGHRQTAFASLLVNSVFIGATVQAFRSNQDILGGFLALFSASWYAGNVYGSGLAARRYNANLQERLWNEFEY